MAKNIDIAGRLHSRATGNVVAGADEILDDSKKKKQSQINAEVDATLADLQAQVDNAGKVDDVEVNGVSALDPTTKKVSLTIPISASAEAADNEPGTPTATAEMVGTDIHFTFRNIKGDKGEPLTWADLTDAQKAELKGDPGDSVIVGEGDLPLANTLGNSSIKAITQKVATEAIDELDGEIYERTPVGYSNTEIDLTDSIIEDGNAINCVNGNVYQSNSYNHTDFIDISGYSKIKYGKATKTAQASPLGIAFYSSANIESFVIGIPAQVEETIPMSYVEDIVDVPEGANYVRLSVFKSQDAEPQYLYGLTPVYTRASKIASLKETQNEIRDEIDTEMYVDVPDGETQTNLEPMSSEITENRSVRYDTGGLVSSQKYDASGLIDVSAYKSIIYGRPKSNITGSPLGMAFYNSEEVRISGQQALYDANGMDAYVDTTLPVPAGAKYVRISINKDTQSFGIPKLIGIKQSYAKKSRFEVLEEKMHEDSPQVVHLTQRDVCYGNQIASDGSVITTYVDSGLGCTSFVCCKGASTISIIKAVIDDASIAEAVGIAFYDITKSLVGFEPLLSGEEKGSEESTIDVPESAYYLRATYWDGEHTEGYGEFQAEFTSAEAASNGKREAVGDYIYFTVPVNQAVDKFWNTAVDEPQLDEDVMKDTTGVLLLPSSYKAKGEKTKIIINFHGWSHYVKYGKWGKQTGAAGFLIQKQRWADAGFAVMDCNNWSYELESGQSGLGSRQSMEAYRKCFEWVKANYNIDERPYIICGSAGGPTGINCCYAWNDVRAAVWLDCWVGISTDQNAWNNLKSYFPDIFGFNNAETFESGKLKGYNLYDKIITINGSPYTPSPICPVKVLWLQSGLDKGFYEGLKNSGANVTIRQVEGIEHSDLVSGGNNGDPNSENIDAEIIAYLKSF